jgi:hypothetical protein
VRFFPSLNRRGRHNAKRIAGAGGAGAARPAPIGRAAALEQMVRERMAYAGMGGMGGLFPYGDEGYEEYDSGEEEGDYDEDGVRALSLSPPMRWPRSQRRRDGEGDASGKHNAGIGQGRHSGSQPPPPTAPTRFHRACLHTPGVVRCRASQSLTLRQPTLIDCCAHFHSIGVVNNVLSESGSACCAVPLRISRSRPHDGLWHARPPALCTRSHRSGAAHRHRWHGP